MDEYLTTSEVAEILKVSRRTVLNMISNGKLKGIIISGNDRKSYRILAGELDRFVAEEYERQRKSNE